MPVAVLICNFCRVDELNVDNSMHVAVLHDSYQSCQIRELIVLVATVKKAETELETRYPSYITQVLDLIFLQLLAPDPDFRLTISQTLEGSVSIRLREHMSPTE